MSRRRWATADDVSTGTIGGIATPVRIWPQLQSLASEVGRCFDFAPIMPCQRVAGFQLARFAHQAPGRGGCTRGVPTERKALLAVTPARLSEPRSARAANASVTETQLAVALVQEVFETLARVRSRSVTVARPSFASRKSAAEKTALERLESQNSAPRPTARVKLAPES